MLVARERTIPRLSPERQDRSHREYESSTGDTANGGGMQKPVIVA